MQLSKQLLLFFTMISLGLQAQNIGIKIADGTAPNTTLDVNGAVSFREGTALTLTNGVNSDIALTEYSFFRITGPTAAFSITGFAGGNDGRMLTIMNNTSQVMTLTHQATSTSANQINTGGLNTTIAANGMATLYYSSNLSKWIVTAVTGATPTFTTINTGTYTDSMIVINNGVPGRVPPREYIENYSWGLDGNAGTVDGTHFLGTMDNIPLSMRVNNQKAGRIDHLKSNAFWGYQAGNSISTGTSNAALGQSALAALTIGTNNVGIGTSALTALTSGTNNVAMGSTALSTMTTGSENIAIGSQSGLSNTTGVRNVSIGYQSARNGTHSNSIMIGYQAGLQNAASNNVFIGSLSGPQTSTGSDNIGLGYYTLFQNQTGKNNIGIGSFALSTTTAAWGNTAIGHMSSTSIQTGQANTALGDSSLMNNVLGSNNTHIGYRAGLWTTGSNNIAIGYNATLPVTTADNQLALGTWLYGTNSNLGINITTPQYKLDIDAKTGSAGNPLRLQGLQAGVTSDSIISSNGGILRRLSIAQIIGSNAWSTTGNASTVDGTNFIGTTDNIPFNVRVFNQKAGRIGIVGETYLGYQSGNNVTSGQNNTLLGYQSGFSTTNAWGNTAVGYRALRTNTTGQANVAIGDSALYFNTTGANNTTIGYRAGSSMTGSNNVSLGSGSGTIMSGSNNVAIGTGAGSAITSGSNNIAIGLNAQVPSATASNQLSISNIIYGVNMATRAYVGINTSTPVASLHVEDPTGADAEVLLRIYKNGVTSNIPAVTQQSSNGIKSAPSPLLLGDQMGAFRLAGYDGASFNDTHSAEMAGYASQNWTTTAHGSMLAFRTIPNGSTTSMPRMVIDHNGYVGLGYNGFFPSYKLDIDAQTGSAGNPLRLLGLNAGATSDSIISSNAGVLRRLSIDQIVGASGWGLTGNSGTNPSTNFIGTTDEQDLVFKTNYTEAMRIVNDSRYIGIGTASPFTVLSNHTGNIVDFSGRGSNRNSTILWNSTGGAYGMIVNNADVTGTGSAIMAKINSTDEAAFGLMVNVAGTDAFVVNGSANVGINKGIPEYKLDIDAQTGSAGNPLRLLGLNAGAAGDSVLTALNGVVRRRSVSEILGSGAWSTTGNASTVDGTNFIGTTDNIPFNVRVFNQKAGRIDHINYNAFFGFMSGNSNSGTRNSFFGHQAGSTNSTGSYNTGLGYGAMGTNTTASNNVAIGAGSMESNTTGYDNVAIGRHSMRKNTTFYHNTAVGTYSLQENLGGYSNTAVGWSALNQTTTGNLNTATGAQALIYNITGSNNVASGFQSLYFNTAGNYNTSIGTYAMFKNETGDNNVALGALALSANITGWGNTALGYRAALSSVNGQSNVAIGDSALYNNTVSNNTAIGYRAGMMNTIGTNNTYLGYLAEASANNLSNATAIGANAVVGASNSLVLGGTGANAVNVGIGVTTPSVKLHQDNGNATATYHKFTAGTTTGQTSSDGFDVGVDASGNAVLNQKEALPLIMSANNAEVMRVTSAGNVLIGGNLTPGEVTGVALVNQSTSDQKDDITTTTYNTSTTPSFVVFKARGTAASPASLTNSEMLGGFNVNGYKSGGFTPLTAMITITSSDYTTAFGGDLSFRTARSGTITERIRILSTGNVGIGVAAPTNPLQMASGARCTAGGTWTNVSDVRLKKDIVNTTYGLFDVLRLRPVNYNMKADGEAQVGFIAQEVRKIIPEVVNGIEGDISKGETLGISYGNLVPVLTKAIQEQQQMIDKQREEIANLKTLLTQQGKITEGVLLRLEKIEAALNTKSTSDNSDKADKK